MTTPLIDRLEQLVNERDRARLVAIHLEQENALLTDFLHDLAEHVDWVDRDAIRAGIERLLQHNTA